MVIKVLVVDSKKYALKIKNIYQSPFSINRSMSLPLRHLEAEKSNTKDKNRGSPVETSVFYDEKEDSHARFVIVHVQLNLVNSQSSWD